MDKIELTQIEADKLINVEKHYQGEQPVDFPALERRSALS